jgi:hypothetical protein
MKTPRTAHEEIELLDEIERALVKLTTADLEAACTSLSQPSPTIFKTVIPAKAGTHTECDVTTENDGAAAQRGYGSRRSPG